MFHRLMNDERGFTLVELLVTISILAVLFGIVSLTLTGIGTEAEGTVNSAELGVVQSAVDIYMADENVSTVSGGGSAATIAGTTDADFAIYLRSMPTKCEYSWTSDGDVSQGSCTP